MRITTLQHRAGFFALATVAFIAAMARADENGSAVQFNRDIRPILSDNCFACHGPDPSHRKASLRLDRKESIFDTREKGTIVVPGKPEKSLLCQRIFSNDPDEVMPSVKSHKKLSEDQKKLIARWIAEGAPWEPHWSWIVPARPAEPTVNDAKWVKNPIDAFVLSRLEKEGLSPNPQADKRSLIRRVSLDLIGLPPTPEEVEAFVKDDSSNAYEKVVDRLLASPRYGEHRGRYWLDCARYGDTHGIHNDNHVSLWPYRDWVIAAFNRNLPFDKFTVEQIAGDLLPNRTLEQWVATGFHRCNPTTSEGGSIDAEVDAFYAQDRVQTTCTVWLGVTSGCCVCHDHKFDPMTAKDFYSMTAFFRNTPQRAMDGNISDTPPNLPVPSEKDRPRWESLQAEELTVKAAMEQQKKSAAPTFASWLAGDERKELTDAVDPATRNLEIALDETDKSDITARVDGKDVTLPLPDGISWAAGRNKADKAIDFGAQSVLEIEDAGDLDADQPFSLGGWIFIPKQEGKYQIAAKTGGKAEHGAGWVLDVNERSISFLFTGDKGPADKLRVALDNAQKVKGGTWVHVFVTYDGSRTPDGLVMYIDGKPMYQNSQEEVELKGSTRNKAKMHLGGSGKLDFHGGAIHSFRIYRREINAEEVNLISKWADIRRPLHDDVSKLSAAERKDLLTLYLNRYDAAYQHSARTLERNSDTQRQIRRRSAIALVMVENPNKQLVAHILSRGQYDQPRDEVHPAVIESLGGLPPEYPKNRLGLAWWLIDKKNPLTPRVTINRMWSELFGQGIVRSLEDFGIMGELPSNPELLDWLAVEFRDGECLDCGAPAWDMKHMYKLMVMSATYQQSANISREKLARDADNRLLSRGPRYRMDAEVLRDYALEAGGLLSDKIGGASVKPYQPPGVWEAVAMFSSNTRFYKQDSGESLYRRSLYTYIKRSAPPASMNIFNAPGRLECTVRRERTDTPLQALVTMNDPQWVEAARHLAEMAIKCGCGDFDKQLDVITSRAVSRQFTADERRICRQSLEAFEKDYAADAPGADALIHTGESKPDAKISAKDLAAWTMLASEVMNTDEALNK